MEEQRKWGEKPERFKREKISITNIIISQKINIQNLIDAKITQVFRTTPKPNKKQNTKYNPNSKQP